MENLNKIYICLVENNPAEHARNYNNGEIDFLEITNEEVGKVWFIKNTILSEVD